MVLKAGTLIVSFCVLLLRAQPRDVSSSPSELGMSVSKTWDDVTKPDMTSVMQGTATYTDKLEASFG